MGGTGVCDGIIKFFEFGIDCYGKILILRKITIIVRKKALIMVISELVNKEGIG